MPKRSSNTPRSRQSKRQRLEESAQELDQIEESTVSEFSIPAFAKEDSEQSVAELDEEESMPGNHEWDEEGMSSIPETESQINDDENSNPQDPLPDQSEEDPELLYFIKSGCFEDDLVLGKPLPENLVDNFQPQEYNTNEINRLINGEVNKMTLRTDEEKANLKAALKDVMLEKRKRKEAIVERNVDWFLFTSTISRIYTHLELSNFGMQSKTIPEFDLNLLEICLDKGEKTEGDGENPTTSNGVPKKKFKGNMDASTASSHATF
ncbi:hypothetical protein M3Y97_00473300 [Aphelenchoides bicaudatus]|nr:hypothetical protein M3Y97_00473300 [Aphelenchoides bicaudatus]